MLPNSRKDTSQSTLFTTPENKNFYSKELYSALDPKRLEIRLLQLHPKRLKPADLPDVFPCWIQPGTDAYRLQEPALRLLIKDQRTAESIDIPGYLRDETRDRACKQLVRPLPKGWMEVSFNNHLDQYRYKDQKLSSLEKHQVPDLLYFVNCYTGKSQWELPTKNAPEVPPDLTETFIACELHNRIPLTTMSGEYAAISYCAGSSSKTTKIMINGMWFNAFANLEHSLESFRKHMQQTQGSSAKLQIWTDQVCINQNNHIDKSYQVGLMRQIYHNAEHVFVCLSTASDSQAHLSSVVNGIAAMRDIFFECFPAFPMEESIAVSHQERLLRQFIALHGSEMRLPGLKRLLAFFSNIVLVPWWTRAWVYQEFIVASRVYFLYGSQCLSWPEIAPFLKFFCSTLQSKLDILRSTVTESHLSDNNSSAKGDASQEILKASRSREVSLAQAELLYIEYIGATMKETEAHRERVSYFVNSKIEWSGAHDLRPILERATHFSSTDPRDLIYAFVGLAKPSETLSPDYSKENTICHVLIAAAEKLLESEDLLTILDDRLKRGLSPQCMRLPSWVPDYTSPITMKPDIIKMLITGPGPEFQASGGSKAQATVSNFQRSLAHVKLNVTGISFDTLASNKSDEYGWSRTFTTAFGKRAITSSRARNGDTLWVLHGGRTIYVLRKQEQDYCLVSAALLHEKDDNGKWVTSKFMYGEFSNSASTRGKTISIR